MLPALKLSLDGFQLRDHSLFRRDPPDDERSITDALPTVVSQPQEREGLWFSLSALSPVASGEPPELYQPCLVRMQFQAELRQPFPELFQEPLGIRPVLKTQHEIVSVTDDDYVARCHFPAPDISP